MEEEPLTMGRVCYINFTFCLKASKVSYVLQSEVGQ